MKTSYRIALACGLLPLITGITIFVLWVFTRWDLLMEAGLYTIYGGVALFAIGIIALANYWRLARRLPKETRRRTRVAAVVCADVLLANFAVAAGLIAAAIAIDSSYTVVVRNDTGHALEHVRITGSGCDVEMGVVAPGKAAKKTFWVKGEGELLLEYVIGENIQSATVAGYVTSNKGGRSAATIKPDGSIIVEEQI